ncbi:MAG: ABC transporter permease [Clostridia bacterium]|nr:ABC transporter permease [Clostridia bacterium]
MKKGYILLRLLRSLISLFIIIVIVFVMVYALIPRENVFSEDETFRKLGGKPDQRTEYKYSTWEKLGYIDYVTISDYCVELYGQADERVEKALSPDSPESAQFCEKYRNEGYTIETFTGSGRYYAYKDVPLAKRLISWFSNIIKIDHPWAVQDSNNPDLPRYIKFGTTPTGGLALIGSGTVYKYPIYTDTNFPYIHQNIIKLNFGESYPTFQGQDVMDVIFQSQGEEVKREVKFETGYQMNSAIIFGTLKYKYKTDRLDSNKFVDNYADYQTKKSQPSMIGTSFIMGVIALVLAYLIGLPMGVAMARNKEKLVDKLGMVYIIFIIAVPSLAYIYLFRFLGTTLFGLPSVFTVYGSSDIRSWILPAVSLALPSISSLMLWMRRYVVDQMNSDYVKFAKAKGLSKREIFNNHIFKNAVIPIAHGIPAALAVCITGAIITESVYSVGGMGKMIPESISKYNNSMIVALVFMFSGISVLSVLLGDIILTKVDPRISLSEKAGRS